MKLRRSERAQLGDNTPPLCRASERVAYDYDAANSERIKVTTKSNDSYTKTEHNHQQIVETCQACIKLLPNRGWNQKQKHKKNSLGAKWNASHLAVRLCALRHWKRVSMPPTTQSIRHPLTRAHHIAPRIKTARRFTAKNP